jgi:quinol monooxygenase YgiN
VAILYSILDLHLKPEKVDEALTAYQGILKDTRSFKGCLDVDVVQNVDDPTHVQFIEKWESLADVIAYRAWRAGDGATPETAAFVASPPTATNLNLLEDI